MKLPASFSLRVVKITLVTREGDGYLQFAPLLSKAQTFGLEARILASKLCPDPAHHICRPLEELLMKGATLPSAPEHVFRVTLCHWCMRRALRRHAPSRHGAGGWRPNDRRTDLARSPAWHRFVPRRGAQG